MWGGARVLIQPLRIRAPGGLDVSCEARARFRVYRLALAYVTQGAKLKMLSRGATADRIVCGAIGRDNTSRSEPRSKGERRL